MDHVLKFSRANGGVAAGPAGSARYRHERGGLVPDLVLPMMVPVQPINFIQNDMSPPALNALAPSPLSFVSVPSH